jgi:DNA invertase Pin-like site-specific DNA recombinase
MTALEAHAKLMAILPVRTHLLEGDSIRKMNCARKSAEISKRQKARARFLRSMKFNPMEIAKKLKCTRQTVYNYLRDR